MHYNLGVICWGYYTIIKDVYFHRLIIVSVTEVVLSYIILGETVGVATQSVPPQDDGVSLSIDVNFPFGSQIQSTVYVC